MQYQQGTIAVTNGSQTVLGNGTTWLGNISERSAFFVVGLGIYYQVAAVLSNTQLTLNAQYAGESGSGISYGILVDFTPSFDLPEMEAGDVNTAGTFTRAMRAIDARLNTPLNFSDAARPLASVVPVGRCIFNTTTNAPNWSDGTSWRNASGAAV